VLTDAMCEGQSQNLCHQLGVFEERRLDTALDDLSHSHPGRWLRRCDKITCPAIMGLLANPRRFLTKLFCHGS
jgi:hypothetical protein